MEKMRYMSDDVVKVAFKQVTLISSENKIIQYLGIPVVNPSFGYRASVVHEFEKAIEKLANKDINQNDV